MKYNRHFGFNEVPFSIVPDANVFYLSKVHNQALQTLKYGMERRGGFLLLSGEVGTGKTTVSKALFNQLDERYVIAYILNPHLSALDLLYSIAEELGLNKLSANFNLRQLTNRLNDALLKLHSDGKTVLLVIEEAQNLTPDLLEMLRILTNLETDSHKLLHILLIGQPELLKTLAMRSLRQLKQRVVAHAKLRRLSLLEIWHYIDYRLQAVKGNADQLSVLAKWCLYFYSRGIPRVVNTLADQALQLAYQRLATQVSMADVRHAARLQHYQRSGLRTMLIVLIVGAFFYSAPWQWWHSPVDMAKNRSLADSHISTSNTSLTLTAMQSLATLWGVTLRQEDGWQSYCQRVDKNLNCHTLRQATLDDIKKINMAALATVIDNSGQTHTVVIQSLNQEGIGLLTDGREHMVTQAYFSQQWLRDLHLLLPKVPGYYKDLLPMERNPALVEWVQQQLKRQGVVQDVLITGGIYNSLLVDTIKQYQRQQGIEADGLIGIRTLVRLMPDEWLKAPLQ